jgi:hypothetical protein
MFRFCCGDEKVSLGCGPEVPCFFLHLRFKRYSNFAVTLLGKGGGKPPHSEVGLRRVGLGGYAIRWWRGAMAV